MYGCQKVHETEENAHGSMEETQVHASQMAQHMPPEHIDFQPAVGGLRPPVAKAKVFHVDGRFDGEVA